MREERNSLNRKAKRWLDEKRGFLRQIDELRREVRGHRQRRDEVNSLVKGLKQKLENLRAEAAKEWERYLEIKREAEKLRLTVPTSEKKARKVFEDLEWKIQTTPFNHEEEKMLVEKIRELEAQIATHNRRSEKVRKLKEVSMKAEDLKDEGRRIRAEIVEKAKKSQIHHEKMVETLKAVDGLVAKASEAQQRFLEAKAKADEAHSKLLEALDRRRALEKDLKQFNENYSARMLKKALEVREDKGRQAEEKLRRGEKLTFEEFQILLSKGNLNPNAVAKQSPSAK